MSDLRKGWCILGTIIVLVFLILGFFGSEVYRQAPIGTGALAYFMIGLWTGWSYEPSDVTVRETLPGSVPSLGD